MILKRLYLIAFVDSLVPAIYSPLNNATIISLGGSHLLIGLLQFLRYFIQFLTGPIIASFGSWSDTVGRKSLLLSTTLLLLLSSILLLPTRIEIFILSRILFAFTNHAILLVKASAIDSCESSKRTMVFGNIGACYGTAYIIGPIIGGHLNDLNNGFFYVCCTLVLLTSISLGLIVSLPETKTSKKCTEPKPACKELTETLKNLFMLEWKTFSDIFILKVLTEMAFMVFLQTSILVYLEVYSVPMKYLGYTISYVALLMVLFSKFVGKIKGKFYVNDMDCTNRVTPCVGGMCILVTVLSLCPSLNMHLLLMIPYTLCKAILDTTWIELLIVRTNNNNKGKVLGAFESMQQIAAFITPLISGTVIEFCGVQAGVSSCLVPLFAALCMKRKLKGLGKVYQH